MRPSSWKNQSRLFRPQSNLRMGLISKEEFTKFVEEGPPKGEAVEESQGVSAEVVVGTTTAEGAEATPLSKYLHASLRETKDALWRKKKDLARYKRDPPYAC